MGQAHQHFIADAGDKRKQAELNQKPKEEIYLHIFQNHTEYQQGYDQADQKNNQQESSAAPGVQARELLRVLRGERFARFLAMYVEKQCKCAEMSFSTLFLHFLRAAK